MSTQLISWGSNYYVNIKQIVGLELKASESKIYLYLAYDKRRGLDCITPERAKTRYKELIDEINSHNQFNNRLKHLENLVEFQKEQLDNLYKAVLYAPGSTHYQEALKSFEDLSTSYFLGEPPD